MAASEAAGFQSYHRGSWWDVTIKQRRSDMYLLHYADLEAAGVSEGNEMAWMPITELRFSARKADGWDCHVLQKGMDVSVLCRHPHSNVFGLSKDGIFDVRLVSVKKTNHKPGDCCCKFGVLFYCVKMDVYLDGSSWDRKLLTDLAEMEVPISKLRILQGPTNSTIPFNEVLEAHLARVEIPRLKACSDAFFIKETALSICSSRPRRGIDQDCAAGLPGEVRSNGKLFSSSRSAAVAAAARGAPNADKGSFCGSPPEVFFPREGFGSRDFPFTLGEEHMATPKSAALEEYGDDEDDGYLNMMNDNHPNYHNLRRGPLIKPSTDEKSPPSINIPIRFAVHRKSSISLEDDDTLQRGSEMPRRKRGRPRKQPEQQQQVTDDSRQQVTDDSRKYGQGRPAVRRGPYSVARDSATITTKASAADEASKILTRDKTHKDPNVKLTPGLQTDRKLPARSRERLSTYNVVEDERDNLLWSPDCLSLSSADSDSEGEYKPGSSSKINLPGKFKQKKQQQGMMTSPSERGTYDSGLTIRRAKEKASSRSSNGAGPPNYKSDDYGLDS